jgi:hypothetical protein
MYNEYIYYTYYYYVFLCWGSFTEASYNVTDIFNLLFGFSEEAFPDTASTHLQGRLTLMSYWKLHTRE